MHFFDKFYDTLEKIWRARPPGPNGHDATGLKRGQKKVNSRKEQTALSKSSFPNNNIGELGSYLTLTILIQLAVFSPFILGLTC